MSSIRGLLSAVCVLLVATPAAAQLDSLLKNKLLNRAEKAVAEPAVSEQERENTLGQEWAAVIVGAGGLWANDRAQKYVNRVGRWVAANSERPTLAWKFGVLDSDAVNAFAAPGGYVFITRGLLLRLANEAELAGVLAHEIAHVVEKHHLQAMQTAAGTEFAGELAGDVAAAKSKNPQIAARLIGGIKETMLRGLDRSDEFEADRMGVVLAARAGYDPYGLPAVLQMIGTLNPARPELGLLFATHPDPDSRLDALDRVMSPALERYAVQELARDRFRVETGLAAK